MSREGAGVLVAAALCMSPMVVATQPLERARGETPVAMARRTTGSIHVDGRLDEPDWAATPPIGPLLQREPLQGVPATEETAVRVLYDEQALYVGIVCHESHVGGIVSSQLTRDANLDVDDRITIVLDPFFDHRNGFFFLFNPAIGWPDLKQLSESQSRLGRHLGCGGDSDV